ncbi:hypothetical protein NPIL_527181 [Nephila pilipes]|uniref:Uncharacterized protein n=1 Tax=Nephila pilipes TaxID=299642 RepID=A0A8X6TH21_NEPPI|nr:hypothetical protein NPIL_527181 [Nephila pilipes]
MRSIDTSQWSVTGGCPTGKGCSTSEVGKESAKISCNWESFSCSLAILMKSTTDASPDVVVVAWRKLEVLLLLMSASPRASASWGLKQLRQENETQQATDEIWCCH